MILGICEMGGYLGHVTKLIAVLEALRARGEAVCLVVPDLRLAQSLARRPEPLPCILGPKLPMPPFTRSRDPVNLAEVLICEGMSTPQVLLPALEAWFHLLSLLKPRLLLLDYAPTPALAARVLGIPQVVLGTGFSLPPPLSPLPVFNQDIPVSRAQLLASEQQLLQVMNGYLQAQGAEPLQQLSDVFWQADLCVITAAPQVDGFAPLREQASYLLPPPLSQPQSAPVWPEAPGRRIFAYLKTEYPQLSALMQCFAQASHAVCVYLSGDGAEAYAASCPPWVQVSLVPLDMPSLLAQADLFIFHAGCGTASQALQAGVPSLVIPIHYEQLLTARRLQDEGLGLMLSPHAPAADIQAALEHVLADAQLHNQVRAHAATLPQRLVSFDHWLSRCQALAQGSAPKLAEGL
jgi:UDP:flavonoid glycosyltransferase YjiC (YdhE family)